MDTEVAGIAPTPAAADPNVFVFRIPNTETDISVNLGEVPAPVRMDLLKTGVRNYIANRVNQASMRYKKACEPFDAYDEATKANPLQTAVAKPEGERPAAPDLLASAAAGRTALYEGDVKKAGTGKKTREPKDPLDKAITDTVVRELFDKSKGTNGYKYTDAVKAVGGDGKAFLLARIAEKVAAGADESVLLKFMDDRYIKPARIMLGLDTPGKLKDAEGIL